MAGSGGRTEKGNHEGETAAANLNLLVRGGEGGGTHSSSLFDKRGLYLKIIFISVVA